MKKAIFRGKEIVKFLAVQLDLARQPENLDYIRSFTDFAGKYGYNYLVEIR